jgi:hypothetical protein
MSEVVVQEAESVTQTATVVVVTGGNDHGQDTVVVRRWSERGMVSAEWAVGLLAAMGIAGVLVSVVTNGAVQSALLKFILSVIKLFITKNV